MSGSIISPRISLRNRKPAESSRAGVMFASSGFFYACRLRFGDSSCRQDGEPSRTERRSATCEWSVWFDGPPQVNGPPNPLGDRRSLSNAKNRNGSGHSIYPPCKWSRFLAQQKRDFHPYLIQRALPVKNQRGKSAELGISS
jgi:hypothetical protein